MAAIGQQRQVLQGRGLAVVVALVTLTAACTAGPGTDSEVTPEEEGYLDAVAGIERDFNAAVTKVGDALRQVYNTREAFFTAVNQADFGETVDAALAEAGDLSPPAIFTDDHEVWLDYWSRLAGLDLQTALDSRDLQAVLEAVTTAEQAYGSMIMNVSRDFCLAAAQRDTDFCPAGEDLVGGEYGRAAHEVLRTFQLSTLGLFNFPPDMSPEERALRLGQVQPQIEEALQSAGEALADLDPPAEFEDDHAAFLRFFEDQHQNAVTITEANEAGDMARVLQLFDQSNVVFNRLVDELSPGFDPIGAPFFAGGI